MSNSNLPKKNVEPRLLLPLGHAQMTAARCFELARSGYASWVDALLRGYITPERMAIYQKNSETAHWRTIQDPLRDWGDSLVFWGEKLDE